jgi:flagellar hook-associated protein 2
MSTSSVSPVSTNPTFNGTSTYASDFQQVISRAVAIDSMPLTQMQTDLSTDTAQSSELSTLNSDLGSLQSAVQGVASAVTGTSSFLATASDNNVSASATTGALPGVYTVQVNSLGSYNNTMSVDGLTTITDPSQGNLDASGNFTLSVTGQPSISISASNLNGLVTNINSSGLPVQASIVDVGTSTAHDYRLSIQGTTLGAMGISLTDDASTPNQLLHTLADGAQASYNVNGYATAATSGSDTVQIAPGLSVTLKAQTATDASATTITVTRSTGAVASALQSFATAYNAIVTELDNNHGQTGGALTGQSVVNDIAQALQAIQGYSPGSGPFSSVEDLGLSIDKTGMLTFNSLTFSTAVSGQTDALFSFLGGTTTGGFLQNASTALSGLLDPTTGEVTNDLTAMSSAISAKNTEISNEQSSITTFQNNLIDQMNAADAAIATLQSQATYVNELFQSMTYDQNNISGTSSTT